MGHVTCVRPYHRSIYKISVSWQQQWLLAFSHQHLFEFLELVNWWLWLCSLRAPSALDSTIRRFGRLWHTHLHVKLRPLNFQQIYFSRCGCTVDLSALLLAPFLFCCPLLLTPSFQLQTKNLPPFALPFPSRPHTTAKKLLKILWHSIPLLDIFNWSTSTFSTRNFCSSRNYALPASLCFLSCFYEAATHVSKTETR
jgi:hypothetical protein